MLLWNIWELIITENPLLIVGNDPKECSHAVLTCLSLIHPLTTTADVRPYLTILNADTDVYSELTKAKLIPNGIFGIANPLLTKNLSNFPAILHMDNFTYLQSKTKNPT